MYFKILTEKGNKTKTFDTLTDAKLFLNKIIKEQCECGIIVIGFIVQSLDKYIIYHKPFVTNQFIDDIINCVNQWQYENDTYIECVMLPCYDNILTIEIDY